MSGTYDRTQSKSQLNPAVSYAFALEVEAAFFLPLRSVRVFTKENEFDYYQEGGLNDYVHMLRKPISKPFTFQVERYVGVDAGFLDMNSGFIDPLALGTDLILPLVLYVNRAPSGKWYQNISFTNCARAYVFTGCTVTQKEYGELNAETSKLLTETTTIAYKELFTLNQISPDWERGDVWKMTSAEDFKGSGESHTDNRAKGNDTKATLTGKAEKDRYQWDAKKFPEGNKQYHTDERSRKNDPKSKGESTGKDKMWQISKDSFDGNKKFHTDERGRKNDPKSKGESTGAGNKWIWTGDAKGSGKSHEQNRSKNTKPEPVIWPPTRRALRAQALSEL